VTTKMGVLKDSFIDGWRLKTSILEAEKNPRMQGESDDEWVGRIDSILWGEPVRWDGLKFKSSDFGTLVHAELEAWNKDRSYKIADVWKPYCESYCLWAMGRVETIEAEKKVVDHDLKVVGMVDLIANVDGMVSLLDFKTRGCDGKGKFYNKDCMQLAVEAKIVQRDMGLPYCPDCYSLCICNKTGQLFVKKWTEKMVKKQYKIFRALSAAYDVVNGFDGGSDEE
jgi:hypothetical protein